jgi:hypothetical protein
MVPASDDPERERRRLEHRIYSDRVTWTVIMACCLLFFAGIEFTGLDLEHLAWKAGMFDPGKGHVCLRGGWFPTTRGEPDRVQLCTEWIDPSDRTGETHRLSAADLEIVKGSDGKIRARLTRGINYPLATAAGFLLVILLGGRWVQHLLIRRNKRKMGLA